LTISGPDYNNLLTTENNMKDEIKHHLECKKAEKEILEKSSNIVNALRGYGSASDDLTKDLAKAITTMHRTEQACVIRNLQNLMIEYGELCEVVEDDGHVRRFYDGRNQAAVQLSNEMKKNKVCVENIEDAAKLCKQMKKNVVGIPYI
jgi:hypothetical protein